MVRRSIIAACVLLFLMLVLAALWAGFDWPPPRLILTYGFPPTGGPTGRTMTIEGVEFVELKPGYFRMGSHFLCKEGDLLGRVCAGLHLPWGKQPKHDSIECPPLWVEIAKAFWIARTEVTNAQYERFDPEHERDWPGDDDPATGVSWDDAKAYCQWLAARSGLPIRLPAEAEWEYACRAGSEGEFCFGNDHPQLGAFAWYHGNTTFNTSPVATRRANAWGLFDMHGNVDEWCVDEWRIDTASETGSLRSATTKSTVTALSNGPHMIRGGSIWSPMQYCRSASRCITSDRAGEDNGNEVTGMRLVGFWR